jgi:hypothetical protein
MGSSVVELVTRPLMLPVADVRATPAPVLMKVSRTSTNKPDDRMIWTG